MLHVLLLVGIIAFVAGFIHSALGFGFGIVAITLLPLVIDVRDAHIVISVASVPVLMMAAWSYRDGADWKVLGKSLVGAAICLPLGLLAFEFISSTWLVRGTGLAILLMVLMSYRNRRLAQNQTTGGGSPYFAGAVGGFLAGR